MSAGAPGDQEVRERDRDTVGRVGWSWSLGELEQPRHHEADLRLERRAPPRHGLLDHVRESIRQRGRRHSAAASRMTPRA